MKVGFSKIGQVEDSELKFAVISASFEGKWVFVKQKQRDTWEIPGGHREAGEDITAAAKRELFEETGAVDFNLVPVCDYFCDYSLKDEKPSYGRLYYAEIKQLGELPESEIGQVKLFENLPEKLTYPNIQPYLHKETIKHVNLSIKNIAVLIYDDIELMDFCGPYDVFSMANKMNGKKLFNIYTVAEATGDIETQNGLIVKAKYSVKNCPEADILIIPGGKGARKEMNNPNILKWIKEYSSKAQLILSVCTGALLLASCGLLDGLAAATHHNAVELLKKTAPKAKVMTDQRYVDNGKIVLSAGVASGIDMSLYVLGKLSGEALVLKVKENMEYNWSEN